MKKKYTILLVFFAFILSFIISSYFDIIRIYLNGKPLDLSQELFDSSIPYLLSRNMIFYHSFKYNVLYENVNLEFEFGKVYGLMGGNGTGKSIFFKIISGIITASSGTISYNNQIVGKDIEIIPNLGYCDSKFQFIPYLSGLENLKQLAAINHIIGESKIIEEMEYLKLDPTNKIAVKKYSLGMSQKLSIIQSYMENQDVIIFDEPFNSLDKESVQLVKEKIKSLKQQGKMIFITSHIQNDLEELCDILYKIEYQEIIQV